MRDKKRIKRILKLIENIWLENPDWRLGQLLCNFSGSFESNTYHCEDDEIENVLNFYEERKNIPELNKIIDYLNYHLAFARSNNNEPDIFLMGLAIRILGMLGKWK